METDLKDDVSSNAELTDDYDSVARESIGQDPPPKSALVEFFRTTFHNSINCQNKSVHSTPAPPTPGPSGDSSSLFKYIESWNQPSTVTNDPTLALEIKNVASSNFDLGEYCSTPRTASKPPPSPRKIPSSSESRTQKLVRSTNSFKTECFVHSQTNIALDGHCSANAEKNDENTNEETEEDIVEIFRRKQPSNEGNKSNPISKQGPIGTVAKPTTLFRPGTFTLDKPTLLRIPNSAQEMPKDQVDSKPNDPVLILDKCAETIPKNSDEQDNEKQHSVEHGDKSQSPEPETPNTKKLIAFRSIGTATTPETELNLSASFKNKKNKQTSSFNGTHDQKKKDESQTKSTDTMDAPSGKSKSRKQKQRVCSRYLTDLAWRIGQSVNIYIFRNGTFAQSPMMIHIAPGCRKDMKSVLRCVALRVKLDVGYWSTIWEMDGTRITNPGSLEPYRAYVVGSNLDKGFKFGAYGKTRSPLLIMHKSSNHARGKLLNEDLLWCYRPNKESDSDTEEQSNIHSPKQFRLPKPSAYALGDMNQMVSRPSNLSVPTGSRKNINWNDPIFKISQGPLSSNLRRPNQFLRRDSAKRLLYKPSISKTVRPRRSEEYEFSEDSEDEFIPIKSKSSKFNYMEDQFLVPPPSAFGDALNY